MADDQRDFCGTRRVTSSRIADDWFWKMRTSTLWLIVVCILFAFGLVVWIVVADPDDMKVIASTVNVIGAGVTLMGLSWAYVRADPTLTARLDRILAWFKAWFKEDVIRVDNVASSHGRAF